MTSRKEDPAASARGSQLASEYTVSLHYDRRLYREDIAGSIAHARMLARQAIIGDEDCKAIVRGLEQVRSEIESGDFPWREDLEDIHMNVEARLYEVIGEVAGKLHTARSRNDQISTDTRMYAKSAARRIEQAIGRTQRALLDQAAEHTTTVLPGYTHLQRGQPVLLAHHLLAYFEMLDRDARRFRHAHDEADAMTLGSGAVAGVPYPVDREWLAGELGFRRVTANSMDAVSDRDFALDFLHAASVCIMHLSRLAEELIIWSSEEFGFVQLSEGYTTGSSIMPQKRNPDFAELTRGKTGRVYGHLHALLTTLKGLPLTYNRDLQEDKEGLFDAADTVLATLEVAEGMIREAKFSADRMRETAESSFVLATDIADYLVSKGMSFRDAHIVVSNLSRQAIAEGKRFKDLTLDDYRSASERFDEDVLEITVDRSIAARDVPGGTAPGRVADALDEARNRLEKAFSDASD